MIFELKAVGFGVVLPAVVTAVILWAACRAVESLAAEKRRRLIELAAALAIGIGFAVGFIVAGRLLGFAPLIPRRTWHWLPYLVWAATAFGLLESSGKGPRWFWIAMRIPVSLAVAAVFVPDVGRYAPYWWPMTIGLAAATFTWWSACEPLANQRNAVVWPLVLCMTCITATIVQILASNSSMIHVTGVLFAVSAGALAISLCYSSEVLTRAMTPALAVLLPGLMFTGYVGTFSEVPVASFALIAFAPLLMWIGELRPLAERKSAGAVIATIAVVWLPLVVAVGIAKFAEAGSAG